MTHAEFEAERTLLDSERLVDNSHDATEDQRNEIEKNYEDALDIAKKGPACSSFHGCLSM